LKTLLFNSNKTLSYNMPGSQSPTRLVAVSNKPQPMGFRNRRNTNAAADKFRTVKDVEGTRDFNRAYKTLIN